MTSHDPQVQLRFEFSTPTRPVELLLTLSGIQVMAAPRDAGEDIAASYLDAVGVPVVIDEVRGPLFPVRDLPKLRALPAQVTVTAIGPAAVLSELAANPAMRETPVTATVEDRETLNLNWQGAGGVELNEPFPLSAAAALMALEVPLVAQPEAWDALLAATSLPMVLARARVNLDGFVELTSPVPHQLEIAPVPGLFRVDGTHFGVPVAHADALDELPGVLWEQRPPTYDRAPDRDPELPYDLSDHARAELRGLTARLASTRGQAVVWDHGLGRRIFCLAAVEALEAFPLLVVTSPSAVWAWLRHLELVGRSGALSHDRGDVHIVTYRDLAARPRVTSPASVIFDDLDRVQERNPELLAALHRLDGQLDAYRLASSSSFPTAADDVCAYMSVLRPVEFRADVPALLRYPAPAEQRLGEHVACYLSRRSADETPRPPFRRSSTVVLEPPQAVADALETARSAHRSPVPMLAEMLEVVSAGPSHAVGPKVVKAAELVSAARRAGRRAAVVTRFERTARILRGVLRTHGPEAVHDAVPTGDLAVVHAEGAVPDLRGYALVVFVDYPVSLQRIDEAVGLASEPGDPDEVVVLHLSGTVDDRVAMLAALRREQAAALDPAAPLSDADVDYLLRG